MTSISDLVFEEKIKVYNRFKLHNLNNQVKLPESNTQRRKLFIDWYLREYSKEPIEKNISNLSNYFLYISEMRIEIILFHETE